MTGGRNLDVAYNSHLGERATGRDQARILRQVKFRRSGDGKRRAGDGGPRACLTAGETAISVRNARRAGAADFLARAVDQIGGKHPGGDGSPAGVSHLQLAERGELGGESVNGN